MSCFAPPKSPSIATDAKLDRQLRSDPFVRFSSEIFQHLPKHPTTGKTAIAAIYFHAGFTPDGRTYPYFGAAVPGVLWCQAPDAQASWSPTPQTPPGPGTRVRMARGRSAFSPEIGGLETLRREHYLAAPSGTLSTPLSCSASAISPARSGAACSPLPLSRFVRALRARHQPERTPSDFLGGLRIQAPLRWLT